MGTAPVTSAPLAISAIRSTMPRTPVWSATAATTQVMVAAVEAIRYENQDRLARKGQPVFLSCRLRRKVSYAKVAGVPNRLGFT